MQRHRFESRVSAGFAVIPRSRFYDLNDLLIHLVPAKSHFVSPRGTGRTISARNIVQPVVDLFDWASWLVLHFVISPSGRQELSYAKRA